MRTRSRQRRSGLEARFDRSVPLLVLKIGRYPLGQGSLGAARSLGRVGVPVYAVAEDRFTPVTQSRYLTRAFVSPTTGAEDEARLVEMIQGIVCRLPGRQWCLPTDDESAVLLAEHREEFAPQLIVPAVEASLPRRLANKRGLYETCVANGFPTPRTGVPRVARRRRGLRGRSRVPGRGEERRALRSAHDALRSQHHRRRDPRRSPPVGQGVAGPAAGVVARVHPRRRVRGLVLPRVLRRGVRVPRGLHGGEVPGVAAAPGVSTYSRSRTERRARLGGAGARA